MKVVAPKPANVIIGSGSGLVQFAELHAAGARRAGIDAKLYCHVIQSFKDVAKGFTKVDIAPVTEGIWPSTMMKR
ncbi:MAG: hypothetical protein ACREDM_16080 [Methylocella sp.]